jgi:coenzyme F420-reducing hydrogenase delta subunit
MTALATASVDGKASTAAPRILVFSTNNISDPGIDLAGSNHLHYSPGVRVIAMPCTSGIRPSWILHAIRQGFEGVFVASDGDECALLPDCAKRASRIMAEAQKLLKENGLSPQRLKMAAICSVCAENFAKHMNQFSEALIALRPADSGPGANSAAEVKS